jgi:hypothetical protein
MITVQGINSIASTIVGLFAQGAYIKDGQQVIVPIFRKEFIEEEATLKIYLYLTDEDVGTFTGFQILNAEGDVMLDKPDNITKPVSKGLLVAFKISIKEVDE